MRSESRRIELQDGRVRHVLTIYDDEGTYERDRRRTWFLQTVANSSELLASAGFAFERLAIHHDGSRWIAEAEAVTRGENR